MRRPAVLHVASGEGGRGLPRAQAPSHLQGETHLRGRPSPARAADPPHLREPSLGRGARGLGRAGDLAPCGPRRCPRLVTMKRREGGRAAAASNHSGTASPVRHPARLSYQRRSRIGPLAARFGLLGISLGHWTVLREVQAWEERRRAVGGATPRRRRAADWMRREEGGASRGGTNAWAERAVGGAKVPLIPPLIRLHHRIPGRRAGC